MYGYDNETEEETANNVMAYSGIFESKRVHSNEDLSEEELDASFMILHTKLKKACLTVDNLKKTIGGFQK